MRLLAASVLISLGLILMIGAQTKSEGPMSPRFKEKARRALDAIGRLPSVASSDHPETGFEQRKLDAEKAIDEAKYRASTPRDKYILKLLRATEFLIVAAAKRSALNEDWQTLTETAFQCKIELTVIFEPDQLSDVGRKKAAAANCLARQDAIIKSWSATLPKP